MNIKIVYEDDRIIVIDKPAGIAVQTRSLREKDIESELKKYLKNKTGKADVFVIHRLDQPVSGLCVFAKDKEAASFISKQLNDGRFKKTYRAKVIVNEDKRESQDENLLTGESGTLSDMLYKDGKSNTSKVVRPEDKEYKQAKKALLDYKVVQRDSELFPKRGLLEINLHTGRHHQIRAQLSHAGMPIEGDTKYGAETEDCKRDSRSIELRAIKLEFVHPSSLDTVFFTC